jgi:hypothetical protein
MREGLESAGGGSMGLRRCRLAGGRRQRDRIEHQLHFGNQAAMVRREPDRRPYGFASPTFVGFAVSRSEFGGSRITKERDPSLGRWLMIGSDQEAIEQLLKEIFRQTRKRPKMNDLRC